MSEKKRKRILICGASGFIGFNLFQSLSRRKDFDVVGTYLTNRYKRMVKKDKRFIKADLTDKKQVDKLTKGVDVIIQAAANTSGAKDVVERPYIHVVDNVTMNNHLFKSAYDNNVGQVIFYSCTVAYPTGNKYLKETDMNLNAEFGKYFGAGWMKIYAEKQCEFYSRLGRTKFTAIRHSNIYGPYDRFDLERSHVTAATITKVITANDKITVWGEGKEERDLLFISDLVDFTEKVIDKQKYAFDVFNVGLGKSISVKDLVKKVISLSDRKLKIEYDRKGPTIGTKIRLNVDKAKKEFNWKPRVSLDEGLKKTIKWHKQNFKKYYK
jgi:GDP-L-fucose synthase